jgi:uncharacterized protein YciI
MAFLILGWDATDDDAPARRQAHRDEHGSGVGRMVEEGTVIFGGGLFDHDGSQLGSLIITDHPDRAAADAYVAADPLTREQVWGRVEVYDLRVPDMFLPERGQAPA